MPKTEPVGGNILWFDDHRWRGSVSAQFHGGPIAPAVPVQLIFWGSYWSGAGAGERATLEASVKTLLEGPYTSGLAQYGIAPPTYRDSYTDPSDPPAALSGPDIGIHVWHLIDDENVFPEPDEDGGRNGYFVFLPPGVNIGTDPGAHGQKTDVDFPGTDFDHAWYAYIQHDNSIDTMTAVFSHELVEMATDPETDAWYSDALGPNIGEIGDICQPPIPGTSAVYWETAWVNGVKVMAYWSNSHNACIIPTGYLHARIDGTIDPAPNPPPPTTGWQPWPDGENNSLCRRFEVCCLAGPYQWWMTLIEETANLTATGDGYHKPSYAWSVGGNPVSGSTDVQVRCDVTRTQPTGVDTTSELVSLHCEINEATLTLKNATVAGTFDVDVSVQISDADASADYTPLHFAHGSERTASVTITFLGEEFKWDDNYTRQHNECIGAAVADYVREHPLVGVAPKDWGPDPGPRRVIDIYTLSQLAASTPIETRRLIRSILIATEQMAEHDKELATSLRRMLLTKLGVPAY